MKESSRDEPAAASATTMTAIVVDDEPLGRQELTFLLRAHPDVQIVAEGRNGLEALQLIKEHEPDIVFLDVAMPGQDGLGVVRKLLEKKGKIKIPHVVFVTAYDQYALRAFEVHAVDYLLKPFSAERLADALDRARSRLGQGELPPVGALSAAAHPEQRYASRILVRDGSRVHVLPASRIVYVQAQDDYITISCDGKEYLKEQTLTEAEAALDPAKFVRIHRSFVLNLDCLSRVELDARENRVAVLADGRRLPVSRSGYQRLSSLL